MTALEDLVSLMFPAGLLDYFVVTRVSKIDIGYQVYLEEKKDVPSPYSSAEYVCHGFHDEQVIHDFPLRGKVFDLIIKRRRWRNVKTGKVISREWDLVARGSSLSREFSAFLKGTHR